MNWFAMLVKFGPSIFACIQAAVHALPAGTGSQRADAAIAGIQEAESIAEAELPQLETAVKVGYKMLKKVGAVPAPVTPASA